MLTFTDTHSHLNYHSFDEDLTEVIDRATNNGLNRIMIPGIDLEACQKAINIAEDHPNCYAAIGIHPNDANTWDENTLVTLMEMVGSSTKVLAIGEIGLDYYRDWSTPESQRSIFHQQLNLAKELCLPVIIHIRETMEDSFEILFDWQNQLEQENHPLADRPGVLHAFPGTLDEALEGITHKFKIGVGGPVTFKNAKNRQAVVKELPLDAILLETDAPFLTPHPNRGKRNESSYIPLIAAKIAELKEIPLGLVSKITTENAKTLFQW